MYTHRIQSNRREFKYIISEARAAAIRDFLRSYLEPDEHANPVDNSYAIHSLYLDSPDLTLCNATRTGLKNRFKLRVRFYDDRPESPVYFEIKRRVDDVVRKERSGVRRPSVERLLAGHWPEPGDLIESDPKELASLHRFCSLRDTLAADGRVFVSYLREAYVSPHDDSVRVTFDRQLTAGEYGHGLRITPLDGMLQPKVIGVILELKFTDRFPLWMRELSQSFGLERCSMAKYVTCMHWMSLRAMRVG